MKRCSKCRTERPEGDFGKLRSSVDGLQPICRRCRSEYDRIRYTKEFADKVSHEGKRRRAEYSRVNETRDVMIGPDKLCRGCNTVRPRPDFRRNKYQLDGLTGRCKDCLRDEWRQKKYGLSRDEYLSMLTGQGFSCAVCGSRNSRSLVIDHDHSNGEVRGILCDNCNRGIGLLGDSIENLKSAARYLGGAHEIF